MSMTRDEVVKEAKDMEEIYRHCDHRRVAEVIRALLAVVEEDGAKDKPKVVVLCGSSRFVDIMAVCAWLLERDEKTIAMGLHLLPGWYCRETIPDHLAEAEGVAADMDALHLRKIDLADEIFVVNVNHYIGQSTTREVEYAKTKGIKIRWYTDDPVGEKVNDILNRFITFKEETMEGFKQYRKKGVTEMRPYVLGEDLTGVSVSSQDSPKAGDMIARNEQNHADQWLVDAKYFADHYEPV